MKHRMWNFKCRNGLRENGRMQRSYLAERKVSTLILLESSALIDQWQKALDEFLEFQEDLPEYETKTGRKRRRKSVVGVIHGPKDTSTGIVDIAMAGSL